MDAELNFEHLSSVLSSSPNKDVMVDNVSLPIDEHQRNSRENAHEQKQGPVNCNRVKMTEEFESNYKQIRESSSQHEETMKAFKGFTSQEINFMNDYVDKKSEICYRFYKSLSSFSKRNIFQMMNGIIPVGSNSTKAFLIAKNYLTKPKQNLKNGLQSRVNQHHKKPTPKISVVEQNALDLLSSSDSDDGTVTPGGNLNSLTSPSSASSLNSKPARRLIQAPKRYMDGERSRTSAKSRHQTGAKSKKFFQMGLLPPKYPRALENSCWNNNGYDSQTVRSDMQSEVQSCQEYVEDDDSGLFAISNLLHTGELLDVLAQHQLGSEHIERKCRKLTGSEVFGVFEQMHEIDHNPEAETPFTSQVTIAMRQNQEQPDKSIPDLIPIPSVFVASASLVHNTKPRALAKSFKGTGYTSQKSESTPNYWKRSLVHPKLRLKGTSTINIKGSYVKLPFLTGKTFKRTDLVQQPQQNTHRHSRISAANYIGTPVSGLEVPNNFYVTVVGSKLMPPLKSRPV